MMTPLRTALFSGLATFAMAGTGGAASSIEQPQYTVIEAENGVELRAYDPYIVAEVTVEAGSMREASSRGFRPLAGYIFGDNRASGEIAMTAPVTTQAEQSTKIAMTAPVTTAGEGDGTYKVRFTMPSKWTMETLPVPNNDSVRLEQVEAEQRIVYRFVGARSPERMAKGEQAVVDFAEARGLTPTSTAIIAGYDGPSVPIERKRWEVMVIVE